MPEAVEAAFPRKHSRGLAFLLVLGVLPAAAQSDSAASAFFEARIRPVLVERCYACHTDSKLGGLRVDSRVALLEGGKRGPAIVVGAPAIMQTYTGAIRPGRPSMGSWVIYGLGSENRNLPGFLSLAQGASEA